MKKFIVILALFLSACGGITDIEFHEISKEELARRGEKEGIVNYKWGRAEWKEAMGEIVKCDVYVMPENFYPSDACYQATIDHEIRHCDEGNWHKKGEIQKDACFGFAVANSPFRGR